MWIDRTISRVLQQNRDPVQIIRGPRQCGKTSLVLHLGKDFEELSLDDIHLRALAKTDPAAFLAQFADRRIFIDEVQYAPELFPEIKRRVDLYKRTTKELETIFRLTGSNQILMDRHVKESLAGRASYFEMNTLSVSEILSSQSVPLQTILYQGGWPELYAREGRDVVRFLNDYITSYIEKDIVLAAGIQKQLEFTRFIKLLAGRVGQLLDLTSLSNDTGVDVKTIKEWVSVLEQMRVVALCQPYFSNSSKRLIKSPKVYFLDTGLACRLQGWTAPDPIITSPLQGGLFENLVFTEIYKLIINHQLDWSIFHWRSRDGEEIDFLIRQAHDSYLFVEAKMSFQAVAGIERFPEVRKVFKEKMQKIINCHMVGERVLKDNVPIALLSDYLLNKAV